MSPDVISKTDADPLCVFTALPSEGLLSVVHISDDGMSFLEPLEITDTHVIVKVSHLSAFGLVWDLIKRFWNSTEPIKGQVLLFLRPPNPEIQKQNLKVFLLPSNIPIEEVKIIKCYSFIVSSNSSDIFYS